MLQKTSALADEQFYNSHRKQDSMRPGQVRPLKSRPGLRLCQGAGLFLGGVKKSARRVL